MLPPRKPAFQETAIRDKTRNELQKAVLLWEVTLTKHSPSSNRLVEQSAELCSQSQKLITRSQELVANRYERRRSERGA